MKNQKLCSECANLQDIQDLLKKINDSLDEFRNIPVRNTEGEIIKIIPRSEADRIIVEIGTVKIEDNDGNEMSMERSKFDTLVYSAITLKAFQNKIIKISVFMGAIITIITSIYYLKEHINNFLTKK